MGRVILFVYLVGFTGLAWGVREKKEWTFLFYVAGDEPEIDPYSRLPIRKLEQVGSDDSRWLVAETDLHLDPTGQGQISEPARRYEIARYPGPIDAKDFATLAIQSPVVWQSAGEANSGSAQALEDFIAWGIREYPAERTALFVLGHSWGWRGIGQDYNPGFVLPKPPKDTPVDYTMFSLTEFRAALSHALPTKLDLLVMDACNLGSLEFLYEIRDLAKVVVSSVTEMPFMSFDYATSLQSKTTGAQEFANRLVADLAPSFGRGGSQTQPEGDYPPLAVAAMDLERMQPFWPRWREFVSAIRPAAFKKLFLKENALWLDISDYGDVVEILQEFSRNGETAFVRERALDLKNLLLATDVPADERRFELSMDRPTKLRLTFEGDELLPEADALKQARLIFDYLNPSLLELHKSWAVHTKGNIRTIELTFTWPAEEPFSVNPHIAGASWGNIEILKNNAPVDSYPWQEAETFSIQTRFAPDAPYLSIGRTFGASRNHGLVTLLKPFVDPAGAENNHYDFSEEKWIVGRDLYRQLSYAKATGWDELIFQVPNTAPAGGKRRHLRRHRTR